MTNLNNAFEVAEKYLDIPKMLDAEGELECLNLTCLPNKGSPEARSPNGCIESVSP